MAAMRKAKITITGNLAEPFKLLAKEWGLINYAMMAEIGYEGRRELYESFLRGQVINLQKYPRDRANRRTASYQLKVKEGTLKISSYPLNLYEPEQVYEAAASAVEQRIESALMNFDADVLQKRLDKIERKTS